MATITQVKQGLADRLETITTLSQVHVQVPTSINPPAAVVMLAPGQFLTYDSSSDSDDLDFVVRLLVSRADEPSGQDTLDAYLARTGTSSIRAAVAADPTLGGIVADTEVPGATDYGNVTVGDLAYFGCDFPVRVLMS